jgi:hypothetical protein
VAAQTFANSRQVHPAAQSMRAIFSDVFAPRKDRQIDHCACPTIFFIAAKRRHEASHVTEI